MKRLVYGGVVLVPMAMPTSWRKCLSLDERLLFFRMVSSNTPIVWGLEDQEDVIYELLPERDCPDEGFPDGLSVMAHEEVGIWWGSLGSHGYASKLGKMPVIE